MTRPRGTTATHGRRIGGILADYRRARGLLESLAGDFSLIERRLEQEAQEQHPLLAAAAPPAATPTLEIRCLGSFSVLLDGVPLTLPPSGKPVAVLKLLAARGGRATARDLLLEALWPEADSDAAANRLRVALHGLRRMVGDAGSELIAYKGGNYRLAPGHHIVIDAERFEELWQQGQRLDGEGRQADAAAAYSAAERLYRGDYLEDDAYEDWTLVRREYLRDAHFNLLFRLSLLAFERGDDVSCGAACHKILRQDPLSEEAYRVLMVSHSRRGQLARALRWYHICEQVLRSELGVSPSAETTELRDAIRAGRGSDFDTRDAGIPSR